MTYIVMLVLVLLCLLHIKHMFADYFFQTPKMLSGRDQYLHWGRAQHAAIHAAGSAIALAILSTSAIFTLIIVVIEGIVHFHIDWGKGWYSNKVQHTSADPGYWRAFGVDQTLHQLTYVAMAAAWANYEI